MTPMNTDKNRLINTFTQSPSIGANQCYQSFGLLRILSLSKRWFKKMHILGILLSMLPTSLHAQTTEGATGFSEYQNRIYTEGPNTTEAISLYSGHLKDKDGVNVPTDGAYKLVQSAIGFPVAGGSKVDVLFGGVIEPPEGADVSRSPTIDPASKAFHVLTQDEDGGRVYAGDSGYVTITWKDSDGNDLLPAKEYLIGNQPVRTPMGLYHTHNPDADFKELVQPPQTGAPAIDLSAIEEVIFHFNAAIPEVEIVDPSDPSKNNPYLIRNSSNQLCSRENRSDSLGIPGKRSVPGH